MKLIAFLLVVFSITAQAQIIDITGQEKLNSVLTQGQCEIKVVHTPIKFEKGIRKVTQDYLHYVALAENTVVARQVPVGRVFKIANINFNYVRFDNDKSIYGFCVLDAKKSCLADIDDITVEEIEKASNGNLKITCRNLVEI